MAVQQRRRQRRRNREQRRRQRQRERTRRQKQRQENRTRRAEGRQSVRLERVKQKGASGFYTPQGIKARGDVATKLVGQGIDIAGMVATGGASGVLGGLSDMNLSSSFGEEPTRRDEIFGAIGDFFNGNGGDVSPMSSIGASPMFGGMAFEDEIIEEEKKPFYTNPLVIVGGLGALYFLFGRRK